MGAGGLVGSGEGLFVQVRGIGSVEGGGLTLVGGVALAWWIGSGGGVHPSDYYLVSNLIFVFRACFVINSCFLMYFQNQAKQGK